MSEEALEYKKTLDELKSNNKTMINLLTILAEDYKKKAVEVVDTIVGHLQTVPSQQKLLVMYVTDSILKNVQDVYIGLFAKKIVTMFVHVFQNGDEKIRLALYKLRVTWAAAEVFLPSKLYEIDMNVNALDSAWPICNPRGDKAKAAAPSTTTTTAAKESNSQTKVFVNRKFINDSTNGSKKNTAPTTNNSSSSSSNNTKPSSKNSSKKAAAVNPLDKLLPKNENHSGSGSTTKRKSPSGAGGSSAPKRKAEHDQDLRRRNDEDLRVKPKITPTSVIGTHAFKSVPPFVKPTPPPPPAVNKPPVVATPPSPPPPAPTPKPATITSDNVKLDIPQNNRIFAQGKAYEVMFINEIAVIERDGNPHRIYFAGQPRNVFIDRVAHMLAFGETKNVEIEGSYHSIRFGAPSRELYIGGHPFKGQFGGSIIHATINGRKHDIRLEGPAPEVRIEPDPAYDLARFLNKMREEKKVEMKEPERKPVGEDPFNILKKLQMKGYLKPSTMPSPPIREVVKPRMPVSTSAPVLTQTVMKPAGVERRACPSSLMDFNMALLKIRYDSVVESILKKREDSCPVCGMRMDGMPPRSAGWTEHMDWHVKRNLSKQDANQYRLWYPGASNWLVQKSADDDVEARQQVDVMEKGKGVPSNGQDKCAICREQFKEIYDDDEDVWRLSDTVEVNGKIVHTACSSDASLIEPHSRVESKEEPEEEDVKPIINSSASSSSNFIDRKRFHDRKHPLVGI